MNPVCEQCEHSMRLNKQDDCKKYMNEHGMVKQEDGEWICDLLLKLKLHPHIRFHDRLQFTWDDPILFLARPMNVEDRKAFEQHCPYYNKLELLIKMKKV